MEFYRLRKSPWVWWCSAAFILFLLPGLIANAIEDHHILLLLELMILPAVFGLQALFQRVSGNLKWILTLFVLGISFFLDFYHFSGPYLDPRSLPKDRIHWRSSVRHEAYDILKLESEQQGPLWILTQFTNTYEDQTLRVAVYPFDACHNPRLKGSPVKTLACFTEYYYEPFLQKRFPEAKFIRLIPTDDPDQPKRLLVLLPLNDSNRGLVQKWTAAEDIFQDTTSEWTARVNSECEDKVREILSKGYASISGDPFLESVFWNKMDLAYWINKNYPKRLECIEQNMQKGYPTALAYYYLGVVLLDLNQFKEAKEAFEKAVQSPMNDTVSELYLRDLKNHGL